MITKRSKLVLMALFAAVALVGCGGNDVEQTVPTPQATTGYEIPVVRTARFYSSASMQSEVVSIAGYRDNFTVTKENDTVTVTSKIDPKDVRTYTRIKVVKFADKWVSFDLDGIEGQVYRIYQAAFDRKPDEAGLGFWITIMRSGKYTMQDVAVEFGKSPEFKSLYGDNVTNEQLIALTYRNVLDREPDQAGYDFWLGVMKNSGVDPQTLLFSFSESNENKAKVNPSIQQGFDYVPYQPSGPIVPKASSYENAKNMNIPAQTLPQLPFNELREQITSTYATADFFHDGTMSMVAFSAVFSNNHTPGKVYFFKKDAQGNWQDKTSVIIDDAAGCISPRKLAVADFNGDGKPDVFAACHGVDAEPFPGEYQRVLMSQNDGTYKNTVIAINCFCHSVSAAELTTRGYADVIVQNGGRGNKPFFLMNNRDGTFTADYTRTPDLGIFPLLTVEFIDINNTGKFDLFVAGNDTPDVNGSKVNPTIYKNNGQGKFFDSVMLPASPVNSGVLDLVYTKDAMYLLRVAYGPNNSYAGALIQKIDLKTNATTTIFSQNKFDNGKNGGTWLDWIIPVNGYLTNPDASYGLSVPMQ